MLSHYKGKLSGPCQICFSFGRERRASTVSQCEEKWLDGCRKCPITGGLLLPVGFPLEQLSVSVSLGKPQKHSANEASVRFITVKSLRYGSGSVSDLCRLLTSPLSVQVERFSVNEHVVKERAAADRGRSGGSC